MKTILLILVVIALLGVGYFFLFANKGAQPTSQTTQMQTTQQPTASPSSSPSAQNTVTLTANGYSPATLTISAGQTVTWKNSSGEMATVNSDPHPTHANYPPLNLGQFADGSSLSLTFPTAGTFGYHDHLNPSLRGTIIVK